MRGKRKKKHSNNHKQDNRSPEGAEQTNSASRPATRKGEAHQNAPRRPARATQPRGARTQTRERDPGVASYNRQGAVSASWRNSPSAPAECPVGRQAVPETGHHTTAAHAAEDRRRRNPPAATSSRGPRRVQRGASPAPLPWQLPAARTNSLVPGQPPPAPRSSPVNPGSQAPGVGKGTAARSDWTDRGAAHQGGGRRDTREQRCRPQPRHTDSCQAPRPTGCRKPRQRAQPATNHGTGTGARQHQTNKPQTRPGMAGYKQRKHTDTHTPQHPSQEWRGAAETRAKAHTPTPHTPVRCGVERAHKHTHANTQARSGWAQTRPKPKHTHQHRTLRPGVAGYKRSRHTNTHTPHHPSQEWRGAAKI